MNVQRAKKVSFFRLVEMTFGLVHAALQLAQISIRKTDFLTP